MSPDSVAHTYLYRFPSHVEQTRGGSNVRLAASPLADLGAVPGEFFEGRVLEPRRFSEMLLALASVVAWDEMERPGARPMLDPVVTSHDGVLRFEGFSGTCSMHVRVDITSDGLEPTRQGRGTTNVDFNRPMRTALGRVREGDETRLDITREALTLTRGGEKFVERKVELPTKWLRGFCEVSSYQRRLAPRIEVRAEEGLAFLRTLPRKAPKRPWFVTASGGELLSGLVASEASVSLRALDRLRLLEPVLKHGGTLRIWASDDDAGLWEVIDGPRRFSLLLGGDPYRGFSAGGALLEELSHPRALDALADVRASLRWQSQIDVAALARDGALPQSSIESALAVLGAQGLVGFDPHTGHWFHRELPFDLGASDQIHPRIKGARQLTERGLVKQVALVGSDGADYQVQGSGVAHYVRVRSDGDKCSCTWFATHEGKLGPCKHVLAAKQVWQGSAPP